DHAAEIEEWTIVDLHGFANFEMDFRTFVIFALGNLRLDRRHFVRAGWAWTIAADETDDARSVADEIPRLLNDAFVVIEQNHIHEDVTRIKLAGADGLL